MRVERIARPGASYDASAAAQTFSYGGILDIAERKGGFREMGKMKFPSKIGRVIWAHAWFRRIYGKSDRGVLIKWIFYRK